MVFSSGINCPRFSLILSNIQRLKSTRYSQTFILQHFILNSDILRTKMYSNFNTSTATTTSRSLKRQRDDEPLEPPHHPFASRPYKRSKSENVTQLRRYLI